MKINKILIKEISLNLLYQYNELAEKINNDLFLYSYLFLIKEGKKDIESFMYFYLYNQYKELNIYPNSK